MNGSASIIDKFVKTLNEKGLEPLFEDAVPSELRTKELADISGMFEWKIRSAEANPWVVALQQRLPSPFPPLYYELISRYRFAEFEFGPIMFLANTGTSVFNELSDVIFRDKGLFPLLLQHGLIQFGKQAGGGYDPICFDMPQRAHGDAPVVQIDHEDVLIRNKIRKVKQIAPNFAEFVEQVISAGHLG